MILEMVEFSTLKPTIVGYSGMHRRCGVRSGFSPGAHFAGCGSGHRAAHPVGALWLLGIVGIFACWCVG